MIIKAIYSEIRPAKRKNNVNLQQPISEENSLQVATMDTARKPSPALLAYCIRDSSPSGLLV